VKPHFSDAWLDETKTRDGYEIPFTRYFYRSVAVRPREQIEADIRATVERLDAAVNEILS
jgi:type I restriction enzyme M protein